MKVFVVGYNGTDTDEIIGVFKDIENARQTMYKDYNETPIHYEPDTKVMEDNRIYIEQKSFWFDEWYVVETELM